jgi:hypothetical protein
MKGMSVFVAMIAVLFLAAPVLAAGQGNQSRGLSRTPGITPGGPQQGIMTQQRNMSRQQLPEQRQNAEQRMEQRGPQATLPEQASDTARAAVENAGMGQDTAAAVQATKDVQIPEEPVTDLPEEPATDLPDAPAGQ